MLRLDYSRVESMLTNEEDFDKILLFLSINHPDHYPNYVSTKDFSNITSKKAQHEKIEKNQTSSENEYEYEYTLIRFNEPSPPLVGIDLINYGPFKTNDVANMPYKNAKILIYEKIAEKIEIS